MQTFNHSLVVPVSLEEVAAFHKDTNTLKALTPPPVFVQIHKVEPLAENSISEFTMWVGPIPLRWVALHTQVDPQRLHRYGYEAGCGDYGAGAGYYSG